MEYPFIGDHPSIQKIKELISLVADTAFNVLLLGETGTGKEVVSRMLHAASSNHNKRFVKVNCAALPLTLLESELFGYEKGAFTGADKEKPGKFELAADGVIFLDEIGDIPLALQIKLLHVLQSGEFNRLGGTRDIKVNTWIISSTNHDLDQDMKAGVFREDLYYRLNIIKIEIPPLRERREDIPLLCDYFLKKFIHEYEISENPTLNSDIMELFHAYPWPGNVRELSGTILKLLISDDEGKIKNQLLANMEIHGLQIPGHLQPSSSINRATPEKPHVEDKDEPAIQPLKQVKADAVKTIEKKAITYALNDMNWNKREAARMLKISYKALFNKINEYGIGKAKDKG